MNASENYIQQVLYNLQVSAAEKEQISAELRSHFQEAQEAGQAVETVIQRLGSPAEVAANYMAQIPLEYAGFWLRLAAFWIDFAILFAAAIGAFALFVIFSNLASFGAEGWWRLAAPVWITLAIFSILGMIGVIILYFPILEGRFGRTVGKRLLGLRVLKENGLPVGYKEAFLRRLSFYFEIWPIDALFIPFSQKKQRAFDMVARTVVVRDIKS